MNKHLNIFSSVKYTIGQTRALLYDIENGKYSTVPNSLIEVIKKLRLWGYSKTKQYYNAQSQVFDKYIGFLIENGYAYFSSSKLNFEDHSTELYSAFDFNEMIIDYSKSSTYNLTYTLKRTIKMYRIRCFQIRFFSFYSEKFIRKVLDAFEGSIVRSVELYAKVDKTMPIERWDALYREYPRLNKVYLHGIKYHSEKYDANKNIEIISEREVSKKNCGVISESFFTVNLQNTTIGKTHNSCLYKKIAIDEDGFFKNCPSQGEVYGRIDELLAHEKLLLKEDYTKLWNINKDKINECKICEFRDICIDCRAYIENPKDIYSKPLKCGYNPHTNQWNDWKQMKTKIPAITFYDF